MDTIDRAIAIILLLIAIAASSTACIAYTYATYSYNVLISYNRHLTFNIKENRLGKLNEIQKIPIRDNIVRLRYRTSTYYIVTFPEHDTVRPGTGLKVYAIVYSSQSGALAGVPVTFYLKCNGMTVAMGETYTDSYGVAKLVLHIPSNVYGYCQLQACGSVPGKSICSSEFITVQSFALFPLESIYLPVGIPVKVRFIAVQVGSGRPVSGYYDLSIMEITRTGTKTIHVPVTIRNGVFTLTLEEDRPVVACIAYRGLCLAWIYFTNILGGFATDIYNPYNSSHVRLLLYAYSLNMRVETVTLTLEEQRCLMNGHFTHVKNIPVHLTNGIGEKDIIVHKDDLYIFENLYYKNIPLDFTSIPVYHAPTHRKSKPSYTVTLNLKNINTIANSHDTAIICVYKGHRGIPGVDVLFVSSWGIEKRLVTGPNGCVNVTVKFPNIIYSGSSYLYAFTKYGYASQTISIEAGAPYVSSSCKGDICTITVRVNRKVYVPVIIAFHEGTKFFTGWYVPLQGRVVYGNSTWTTRINLPDFTKYGELFTETYPSLEWIWIFGNLYYRYPVTAKELSPYTLKGTRPEITIKVVNDKGRPVEGARVYLSLTYDYNIKGEEIAEYLKIYNTVTGKNGIARIRLEIPKIPGMSNIVHVHGYAVIIADGYLTSLYIYNTVNLTRITHRSLPDLTIRKVRISPSIITPSSIVHITFFICNIGTGTATNVSYIVTLNGTKVSSGTLSYIMPGICIEEHARLRGLKPGTYNLSIIVNPYHRIAESNENNNKYSTIIIVHPFCDFNLNGKLDIGDAILGLRILVGTYHSNIPCDLNHNGRLDIGDIILLLEKILR